MLRRTIVGSVLASALLPFATAAVPAQKSLSAGGMRFTWLHVGARFIGRLHGPTAGWIAVGFNERRRLAGTRFVIAHVSTSEPHAEVHLAEVPEHRDVAALGAAPDLLIIDHGYEDGVSRLEFSLPAAGRGPLGIALTPGATFHAMLAWSHARDFQHHSAWRGHFDIIL